MIASDVDAGCSTHPDRRRSFAASDPGPPGSRAHGPYPLRLVLRSLGLLLLAPVIAACAGSATGTGAASAETPSDAAVIESTPADPAPADNTPAGGGGAASPAEAEVATGEAGDASGSSSRPVESRQTPTPTPTPTPSPFVGTELPRAPIGFEELARQQDSRSDRAKPVAIGIAGIGVVGAEVIPVGVNPDASFEVPPADQVGWYEFGSAPGEAGSAVLAAHIAFDGVDGVFRHLADVEEGTSVEIAFDDGSTSEYTITTVTEYDKQELPDSLFAREGAEQLALITCGGEFNRQLSSYESNIVAIAVPVGSG